METIKNRNESFRKLEDLPKSRKRIIEALQKLGKASNREISEFLRLPINCVTGRCKELREQGLIIEDGSKFDSVTNRKVTVFRLK